MFVFLSSFATKYVHWQRYNLEQTKFSWPADAQAYQQRAILFLESSTSFAKQYENVLNITRPLFIVYFSSMLKVFGYENSSALSLVNIVFVSVTMSLLVLLAFNYFGLPLTTLNMAAASFFAVVNPLMIFHAPFCTTDIMTMCLLALGFFIMVTSKSRRLDIWLTIYFALLYHFREMTAPTFAAFLFAHLLTYHNVKRVAGLALLYVGIVIPWYIYLFWDPTLNIENPLRGLLDIFTYRAEVSGSEGVPLYLRFWLNLFQHFGTYISDTGEIGTQGWITIPATVLMFLFGVVGIYVLFKNYPRRLAIFVGSTLTIYACMHGIIGSLTYMRDRLMVEHLWVFSAIIGVCFVLERLQRTAMAKISR